MEIDVFSKNLKNLRKIHGLTNEKIAKLIKMNSRGSYSKLENIKSSPSFFTLLNIAKLFSVDIDWLVGRVKYPYQEEIIANAEEGLFPLYVIINEQQEYFPAMPTPPAAYTDPEKRKKTYSLPVRADILYIAHLMQFLVGENPAVANPLWPRTDKPADPELYNQCKAWLHELWENRPQEPLFDILKSE